MVRIRICEICKETIEEERAELIPDTRLCVKHARMAEKHGGEFRLTAEQERTSKKTSMKVNYGGITTARKRNQRAIDQLRDEWETQPEDGSR
jgi:hypothetical protein